MSRKEGWVEQRRAYQMRVKREEKQEVMRELATDMRDAQAISTLQGIEYCQSLLDRIQEKYPCEMVEFRNSKDVITAWKDLKTYERELQREYVELTKEDDVLLDERILLQDMVEDDEVDAEEVATEPEEHELKPVERPSIPQGMELERQSETEKNFKRYLE